MCVLKIADKLQDERYSTILSNFRRGNVGRHVLLLGFLSQSTELDDEEADGMASNGSYEDSKIVGHNREHNHVSKGHPDRVNTGLSQSSNDRSGPRFNYG